MNKSALFDLSNTNVVLAGCDGLIGSASMAVLQDCGAQVFGFDLQARRGSAVDVTNEAQVAKFFSEIAIKGKGKTEWAFINASYPRTGNWGGLGFENVSMEAWNENVRLHLGSAFFFAQQSVNLMKEHGGGSLVQFSSIYGLGGPDLAIYEGTEMTNPAPYAAIKSGIAGLSRYISTVFGEKNIRSNVIAPGGIRASQPASFVQAYEKRTPLRRMATADDIAGAVAFLASPAARYITGQVLPVDGGWSAW